jgi:hypothetical protein
MAKLARRSAAARTLYVGITGHRPNRMPQSELPRLKEALAATLAAIQMRHPSRACRLLSGLAEGADRLAAFTALGMGWPLDAILAFHRGRFQEDFPDAYSKGEFRALLAAAATVLEPSRRWHVGRDASEGYEAMANAMLGRCDILVAIWDGERSQGRGGTVDVIDAARRQGIKVIWLHATKREPPRTMAPGTRMSMRRQKAEMRSIAKH